MRHPGWRAVVTSAAGNEEWKTKLPAEVAKAGWAALKVDEISDDEAALLSEENAALAIILNNGHPARGIARNLFYLSRMIELGADQAEAASRIKTEMDLAHLWWRYGGGRSEDKRKFARLKVLRAIGKERGDGCDAGERGLHAGAKRVRRGLRPPFLAGRRAAPYRRPRQNAVVAAADQRVAQHPRHGFSLKAPASPAISPIQQSVFAPTSGISSAPR